MPNVINLPTYEQVVSILEDLGLIGTNVDTVKINVGSNSDAASSVGSVHAKLKDIKNSLGNTGVVKSVQRGVKSINFATDTMPNTIPISSVNTSKSIILITVSDDITTSNSRYSSGVAVSSFTSTSFALGALHLVGKVYVSWQVIEFY